MTSLPPDLSTVRVARSSATFIPRNAAVLADVDDINNNVGFWQPQADFRIVERIDAVPSTFVTFPDVELESIYEVLVKEFVAYQTRVGLRALERYPDADLVMIYIEQPDGSEHQFLLTDPRQATDPTNPNSIGDGQDLAKIARYQGYLATAYQTANNAVQNVINAVGVDGSGVPAADILVVSDHGFSTFHTAVQVTPILAAAGIDTTKLHIVTSGPAANIYINLTDRPDGGTNTVTREEYAALQTQIADALRRFTDNNTVYTNGKPSVPLFDKVYRRPVPATINDPTFGRRRSTFIAQDSGDVSALLAPGYNFDGRQTVPVTRLGDTSNDVFSVPNFYGAHGYDPLLKEMSAIFYAAGPHIVAQSTPLQVVSNIDVAPTIMRLLAVPPDPNVEGTPLHLGPAQMTLLRAVSRKVHGAAGPRDLVLPLSGPVGVECRKAASGNSHTLVFQFSNSPVSGTAAITSGTGTVVGLPAFSGTEMIVNVTGVTDVQTLGVTLSDVTDADGGTVPSVTVNAAFLLGDVIDNRSVAASDLAEVKSLSRDGQALTSEYLRGDVDASGTIDQTDVSLVRASLGHSLP